MLPVPGALFFVSSSSSIRCLLRTRMEYLVTLHLCQMTLLVFFVQRSFCTLSLFLGCLDCVFLWDVFGLISFLSVSLFLRYHYSYYLSMFRSAHIRFHRVLHAIVLSGCRLGHLLVSHRHCYPSFIHSILTLRPQLAIRWTIILSGPGS